MYSTISYMSQNKGNELLIEFFNKHVIGNHNIFLTIYLYSQWVSTHNIFLFSGLTCKHNRIFYCWFLHRSNRCTKPYPLNLYPRTLKRVPLLLPFLHSCHILFMVGKISIPCTICKIIEQSVPIILCWIYTYKSDRF